MDHSVYTIQLQAYTYTNTLYIYATHSLRLLCNDKTYTTDIHTIHIYYILYTLRIHYKHIPLGTILIIGDRSLDMVTSSKPPCAIAIFLISCSWDGYIYECNKHIAIVFIFFNCILLSISIISCSFILCSIYNNSFEVLFTSFEGS